jgi:hypothetical protein
MERLEHEREIAEGVEKVVTSETLIGIAALLKVVGITYRSALEEGISDGMAEQMAFTIFEKTLNGGASL